MLHLNLCINWTEIEHLTALRIKGNEKKNTKNTYRLNDGTEITHRYGDGAMVLAIKMLRNQLRREKWNSKHFRKVKK